MIYNTRNQNNDRTESLEENTNCIFSTVSQKSRD